MLSLIAILCACTGPTETNTGTSSETAGSATGTETGTEAVTGTETESAAADTDTQTETETKPTVSEDVIGIANVANAGYAMAGSCRNTDGYSTCTPMTTTCPLRSPARTFRRRKAMCTCSLT